MANPFLCFHYLLIHGKEILNVMLPVRTECEIGNLCFRLALMLLSQITLNPTLKKKQKTSKEKNGIFVLAFLTYD